MVAPPSASARLVTRFVDARVARLDLAHHFARNVGPGRLVLAEFRARAAPARRSGRCTDIQHNVPTAGGGLS
jgi:hypothetical protein